MSLFPPPDKDGQIKFIFAKSLPYRTRMAMIAALLPAGLAVQLAQSFWPGFALMAAGSLLGLVHGYDARPKVTGEEKWERVTPDEYAKVRLKAEQLRRWDEDLFDATSTRGLLGACGCIGGLILIYLLIAGRFGFPPGYWGYVGLDAAVVLLPQWVTGVRDYLRKDRLLIKIDLLEKMMARLADPSDAQVFPMLSLATTEGGKKEPEDARLLVRLLGAPEAFYGMQVQVSINTVQGRDFPYLYCVLIGRSGADMLAGYERYLASPYSSFMGSVSSLFGLGPSAPGLVYEPSSQTDVDILVVRQEAVGNTGYSTGPGAAAHIVSTCLDLARKLVANNAPAPLPPGAEPWTLKPFDVKGS